MRKIFPGSLYDLFNSSISNISYYIDRDGNYNLFSSNFKNSWKTRFKKYHCQFFGTTAERSWINSKAILPWEETMSPQDQFEQLTKQLVKIMNIKKKEIRKIKSEVKSYF